METSNLLSLNDIQAWLLDKAAHILMLPYDAIDCDTHLSEIGMDSQEVFALVGEMEDYLQCRISSSVIDDIGSINGIAKYAHNALLKG